MHDYFYVSFYMRPSNIYNELYCPVACIFSDPTRRKRDCQSDLGHRDAITWSLYEG
jgi:hypothetical protein